jgi:hypothetical protein
LLAVIKQQVTQAGSCEVGIELLVIGRRQAERKLITGQGIRACARIGSRVGCICQHTVCQWKLGKAITVDTREMREQVAID